MGLLDWFKTKAVSVKVINGKIGNKREPYYSIILTEEDGIVIVNKRKYYFLGFSEKSYAEVSNAKTLTGAAIGSLFSPFGALVGGALGAKKKNKTNYSMGFKDVETEEYYTIEANLFVSKPEQLDELKPFRFPEEPKGSVKSLPEQIREFKQLFDEGVISEEEFNNKKKQLLS